MQNVTQYPQEINSFTPKKFVSLTDRNIGSHFVEFQFFFLNIE